MPAIVKSKTIYQCKGPTSFVPLLHSSELPSPNSWVDAISTNLTFQEEKDDKS
jgi:hypothetical protein